ncbi:GRASP55/65 PDZ-like domain-containing protein [Melampsora americana]|nr:GRASP55/65 PDZ-like domain-containing protein [Melampsora americana]
MGAQESHFSQDGSTSSGLRGIKGYHVLRVAESSPASEAGIEPFFDYIVGIGGQSITEDGDLLTNWLDQSEGKPIILQVYSSRRQEVRNIRALPNRKWSMSPTNDSKPSLLGLSLRLCSPENALENVWHILDIIEGSPAQDAGLVPFGDWIIGYAGGILRGENDFYRVVEEHEERPLRLFVYNADYEVTREVVIIPNRSWGSGDGLLGCSIGFGLLHRIPKTTTSTTAPSSLIPNAREVYNSSTYSQIDEDEDERRLLKEINQTSSMNFSSPRTQDRSTSPSPNRDQSPASPLTSFNLNQVNYTSNHQSNLHQFGLEPSSGSLSSNFGRNLTGSVIEEEEDENSE